MLVPKLLRLEEMLTTIAISSFKLLLKKNHCLSKSVSAVWCKSIDICGSKNTRTMIYTMLVEPNTRLRVS